MFRAIVSAVAALSFIGFASPAEAGADRAVKALFACNTDFFEVLRSERTAFRVSEVMTVSYEDQRIDIIEFDPPVQALGLRLTSYRQETSRNYGGEPVVVTWGFQSAEVPMTVALALREHFPGEKPFRGTSSRLVPAETDTRIKSFMITETRLRGETGANLECRSRMVGDIRSLPDVADLFFDTWRNRWRAWIDEWLD